jgi:hypothetical protein
LGQNLVLELKKKGCGRKSHLLKAQKQALKNMEDMDVGIQLSIIRALRESSASGGVPS